MEHDQVTSKIFAVISIAMLAYSGVIVRGKAGHCMALYGLIGLVMLLILDLESKNCGKTCDIFPSC